ncbi:MAG: hypothetical protein QOE63_1239, partial [Acidimicrobiaceae bacterium]
MRKPAPAPATAVEPWSRYVDAVMSDLAAPGSNPAGLLDARDSFLQHVRDEVDSGLGALAHNAWLSDDECALLALALGCELDAEHQRVLCFAQGDPSRSRLTLQTAAHVLGGLHRCAAAIGPRARLRRAALLTVDDEGPWAQQQIVPRDSLVWAAAG